LFFTVYGCFCRLYIARGSRFDLNKTQNVLLPAYQVNFSSMMGRPEVTCHHHVALASKIEVSILLTASSGPLVIGRVIGRKGLRRQPIKRADGDVSKTTGEHVASLRKKRGMAM
jgi:hypothetical protein